MSSLLSSADQLFSELTDECRQMFDRTVRIRSRFNKLIINIDHLNHIMRHSVPTIGHISDYYNQLRQKQQQQSQDPFVLIGNVPHQLKYLNQIIHFQPVQNNQQHSSGHHHHHNWKSSRQLDRSLFTINSRPVSIRNLYARAHSPGDVRLSCSIFSSPFIKSSSLWLARNHQLLSTENMTILSKIDNVDSKKNQSLTCQCHCGRCHTSLPISNPGDGLDAGSSMVTSSLSSSHEHNHTNQCEYCHHHVTNGIVSNDSNSSTSSASSSSVVTWSSVTSSTFEPIASTSTMHKNEQKNLRPTTKTKVAPMSSFSSSGDYYPNDTSNKSNNCQPAITATTTKTIDDFFRDNNVNLNGNEQQRQEMIENTRCICSCDSQPDDHHHQSALSGQQNSSNATINQSMTTAAAMAMGTSTVIPPDYWYWWWLMESNCTGVIPNANHRGFAPGTVSNPGNQTQTGTVHDNYKRWSSALTGSSPLKPTLLDETTIWLRENIETRRPESIVIKSASELPEHILLERALSPPCSSHRITLRRHPSKSSTIINDDEQNDEIDKHSPKLRRRWSLLPLRRLSKRWRLTNNNRLSLAVDNGSLSDNERIERQKLLLGRDSSHKYQNKNNGIHTSSIGHDDKDADDGNDDDDDDDPKEIILMSPEERSQLLAKQFSDSQTVSIDVSGRSFDRLSNTRRSLIHSEFHIPRNKILGYHTHRRSRSKSPHHISVRHTNDTLISPYALGHLKNPADINYHKNRTPLQSDTTRKIIAIEKGCQTDNNLMMMMMERIGSPLQNSTSNNNNNSNRFVVPIEVHRNHNDLMIDHQRTHKEQLRRQQHHHDNDADDDYDGYDDDDDDEYVVIRKRNQQLPTNHRATRIDDTTSSTASMELGASWRNHRGVSLLNGKCSDAASQSNKINPTIMYDQYRSSIAVQTAPMTTTNATNLNTINDEDIDMKKDTETAICQTKQNGARSSSGNWSAATSDLIPSSSSSSSPPLNIQMVSKNVNKNLQQQRRNIRSQQQHLDPTTTPTTTATTTNNNNNSEEAESVYSVDNDGYYTSMHTDSGLFFLGQSNYCNQTLPPFSTVNNAKTKTSTFTSQTSLAKRQLHLQQQQQQQRRIIDSNELYRFNLLSPIQKQQNRWKRLNPTANVINRRNHTQLAVTHTTDTKDVDIQSTQMDKHCEKIEENKNANEQNLEPNDGNNSLRRSSLEEFGSNLSINSILSNSDACDTSTAAALDHVSYGTCNSSMADFDCSVSHCSHQIPIVVQQSQSQGNKQQQQCSRSYLRNIQSNRLRTASGTYQEDETTTCTGTGTIRSSSSSETLHTNDYEESEPMNDDDMMTANHDHHHRNHVQKTSRNYHSLSATKINHHPSTLTSASITAGNALRYQKPKRYVSLTESSSASSSCRKLPPPPPPPRVSSMLRTLQKYNTKRTTNKRQQQQRQSIDTADHNSCSSRTTNDHQRKIYDQSGNNSRDVSIVSESNSEYLLQSIHDERRRRLFMDVDTNRSYPPLSYIVDQMTDTATSVSIPSSFCFDDELGRENPETIQQESDVSSNEENDPALKRHNNFQTSDTSISNRTITPVLADQYPDDNDDDNQSQQQPKMTKKQLEHRHLSSPLPPPKLDSFTLNHHNSRQNPRSHQNHRYQSSTAIRKNQNTNQQQQSSCSSLTSSSTIKAPSSPESIPKPKPRNSLILCTTTGTTISTSSDTTPSLSSVMSTSTFSTSTCSSSTTGGGGAFSSPDSTQTIVTAIHTRSTNEHENHSSGPNADDDKQIGSTKTPTQATSPTESSPSMMKQQSSRRLTTEDLFIILHNSKKRHNIRADPQLFSPSQRLSSSPNNSQCSSSSPSGPRSPLSPVDGHKSELSSPLSTTAIEENVEATGSLKRRSWTSGCSLPTSPSFANNNNNSRTRQSLASDRLGPIRPTTLNDFKRLLAQVRPSSSSVTSTSSTNSSNSNNIIAANATQAASTYTALQQILNKSPNCHSPPPLPTNGSISQSLSASSPTSSGISSSMSSPICSPMSPIKSSMIVSSNSSTNGSPETSKPLNTQANQSMANFIKKFSKSKFLSQVYTNPTDRMMTTGVVGGSGQNTTASLCIGIGHRNQSIGGRCPPIPEDDSVITSSTTTAKANTNLPNNAHTDNNKSDQVPSTSGQVHNCTSTWV
ncbi:hypothetical protein DERP_004928 [Dermatophagoides pteronyssinus]|uniref:Serine/threonine-protein kinase DDB_G0282963 n=1 Tax=Dermatophagoides pteronyssinus TaxID=6956 RepID=A0ABQ8JTT7_DERPT|nr:hypothetical protein DERP_004928 [Dermatophagoides pteronyssinus]